MIKKFPLKWGEMTLQDKDRWWLANMYRGNMPQLTWRAAATGIVVGAILSIVNLYIGIKVGFAVGMGVTSVVLSFMVFSVLSRLGITKQITILENNAVQSAATAAGYMTGLITASLPAYMKISGKVFPMWPAIIWGSALAILGVLFAFPLKKRFINQTDYPFPEGKAAAVVLDGIHSADKTNSIKATVLAVSGIFSALWKVFSEKIKLIPEELLNWMPNVLSVKLQNWSINVTTDMALIGIGGVVGIRTSMSWFLGAVINYLILVPILIRFDFLPEHGKKLADLDYGTIVTWSMWPGIALITVVSLYPFISDFKMIRNLFSSFSRGSKIREVDILKDIELPMSVFWVGIPLVSLVVLILGHEYFSIDYLMGLGALMLIAPFTLIAVNSTALTSFTPSSALAKFGQLYAAVLSPGKAGVNLATGSIVGEVTSNASNLLMDIKAGYLLGAKPRQQAVAHVLGAISGSMAGTIVFYHMIGDKISMIGSDKMPLPSAKIWYGLALVLNNGLSALPVSARWAALVAVIVGLVLGWLNERSLRKHKKPLPISTLGLSLGFVTPFSAAATIGLGAVIFWIASLGCKEGSLRDRIITQDDGGVTLASGLIAGAGLIGVILQFV